MVVAPTMGRTAHGKRDVHPELDEAAGGDRQKAGHGDRLDERHRARMVPDPGDRPQRDRVGCRVEVGELETVGLAELVDGVAREESGEPSQPPDEQRHHGEGTEEQSQVGPVIDRALAERGEHDGEPIPSGRREGSRGR
jgi:hypothetical protein